MKYLIPTIAFVTMISTGCTSSPVTGTINITTHPGTGSIGVVDNNIKPVKIGKATCTSILSLFAFGDCSVHAAKTNGGITKVNSVDHSTFGVMFLFGQYKTIVRGE